MINGVTKYIKGRVEMDVFFYDGVADCRHCGFCYYSEPFGLFRCRLTEAYIEKSEIKNRHYMCPVKLEGDE